MSVFSGKCDIYDCFSDVSDEFLQRSSFYIHTNDHREHRLEINNQKDLAKYYPYLVCLEARSKEYATVYLSQFSFIDQEEKEFMEWSLRDLIKYYNKCKRNKKEYIPEEALAQVCWRNSEPYEKELAARVGKFGDKATIDGLHRRMHDYYRNEWAKKLEEMGYTTKEANDWVYGLNVQPRRK